MGEGISYSFNQFQNGNPNASVNDFSTHTNVSPMSGSSSNQTYFGWSGIYHWNGKDIYESGNGGCETSDVSTGTYSIAGAFYGSGLTSPNNTC